MTKSRRRAKIIAVLTLKGGAGKTTIAIQLAAWAHLLGESVAIADCDSQATAFDMFQRRSDKSPLRGLVTVKAGALSFDKVADFARPYDLVIIDGPPRLDAVCRSLAAVADLVVIPVRPGESELWAGDQTLKMLAEADATRATIGRSATRKLFVLNQCVPTSLIAEDTIAAIRESGGRLSKQRIAFRVLYPELTGLGESVFTVPSRSARIAADEFKRVYQECRRELGVAQ